MFSANDKLTIVLTPDCLQIARVKGTKVCQAERIELDPGKWDESWTGGLHLLDQALRQILARFGGTGKKWEADLYYTSPGSICRVDITDQAITAATAGMINGLKQTAGRSNPAQAISMHSDNDTSLVLGVGDTDANLQKLFAWLNRSKITVKQILPLSASVVTQSVIHALKAPEDTVVLYLSGRSSVIGYFEDSCPKILRLIELGYDSVADVYTRHITETTAEKNDDSGPHKAPEATHGNQSELGKDLLFTHGIPMSKGKGEQPYAKLMPALSPVLQRLSIEIKQTLRFASSVERIPSNLLICGPGAAIPNIATALGQSLDLHVSADADASDYEAAKVFGTGTDEWAVACQNTVELKLLPKAALEANTRKNLGHSIKAGAVLAALFLGGQYYYATKTAEKIEGSIADQALLIENIESDRVRRQDIRLMGSSVGAAATLIEETMGRQTDWVAVLGSMPDVDREIIQISEIQGLMNASRPVLNLTGLAMGDSSGAPPSHVLSQYIKSLKEIPSVRGVVIGSTSRSRVNESVWGMNFVLSVELDTTTGGFSQLTSLSTQFNTDKGH